MKTNKENQRNMHHKSTQQNDNNKRSDKMGGSIKPAHFILGIMVLLLLAMLITKIDPKNKLDKDGNERSTTKIEIKRIVSPSGSAPLIRIKNLDKVFKQEGEYTVVLQCEDSKELEDFKKEIEKEILDYKKLKEEEKGKELELADFPWKKVKLTPKDKESNKIPTPSASTSNSTSNPFNKKEPKKDLVTSASLSSVLTNNTNNSVLPIERITNTPILVNQTNRITETNSKNHLTNDKTALLTTNSKTTNIQTTLSIPATETNKSPNTEFNSNTNSLTNNILEVKEQKKQVIVDSKEITEFKFREVGSFKSKGKIIKTRIAVFDKEGKEVAKNVPPNSIIKVAADIVPYYNPQRGVGATLRLKAIQVIEFGKEDRPSIAREFGFSVEKWSNAPKNDKNDAPFKKRDKSYDKRQNNQNNFDKGSKTKKNEKEALIKKEKPVNR